MLRGSSLCPFPSRQGQCQPPFLDTRLPPTAHIICRWSPTVSEGSCSYSLPQQREVASAARWLAAWPFSGWTQGREALVGCILLPSVTGLNSLHPQPPLKLTIIQRLAKGGPLWVDLTHSGSWQQEVNSTTKVASSGKCKISAFRGRRGKVSYKTFHVVCNFHDRASQNLV